MFEDLKGLKSNNDNTIYFSMSYLWCGEYLSRCNNFIYLDCYHEWSVTAQVEIEEKRIHKDAHGNVLNDGDAITLIKNLKVQGSSLATKGVRKIKNIRLIDDVHDIDCKVDCQSMFLKSQFMKKFYLV